MQIRLEEAKNAGRQLDKDILNAQVLLRTLPEKRQREDLVDGDNRN